MPRELTRKQIEELYLPPAGEFVRVTVPELRYFMLDGVGAAEREPLEAASRWLNAAVQPIRREARKRMGKRFVEPPLEALWWCDDPADFRSGRKEKMKWRMMIPAPGWATDEMFAESIAAAEEKQGDAPEGMRLDIYDEGDCVQTMHVGPNESEIATLEQLHTEVLPELGLVPSGPHHEIYLFDPRRTAPERRETVLRQPVRDR